jgi:hypothetical protein
MAKATERVPRLEADLAECRGIIRTQSTTIQRLELKLMDKNTEISTHLTTIRALEVSRDDAELRFLECDDARATLARVLQGIIGEASDVLQAIAPVAVAPVATPDLVVTGTPNIDSQTVIPRDTFQGVKSDPVGEALLAEAAPFIPFADNTSSTDASSDGGTEGCVTVDFIAKSDGDVASVNAHGESANAAESVSVQAPFSVLTPPDDTPPRVTSTTSATPNATPLADATSPGDPEPQMYIDDPKYWGLQMFNPAWISWSNRQ